jgi:serine/threonine-protein kinase
MGSLAVAVAAGLLVTWLLFPSPLLRAREHAVPPLRGVPLDVALAALADSGLRGREAGRAADPDVPAGRVAWHLPVAGTVLPESAVVRVTVSSGPPTVLVPDLADLDLGTAAEVLSAAGLVTGPVDSQFAPDAAGIVLRTRPEPGKAVWAGDTVQVIVSRGPREKRP